MLTAGGAAGGIATPGIAEPFPSTTTVDKPVRILIVDDDEVFANALEMKLSASFTAEYAHAPDYASALAAYRSAEFDLITLDYRMPGGDGLQLLAEFTRSGNPPPVVMVTGHGDEDVASRAFQLGATGYVVKDNRLAALLPEAIKVALEREEARRIRESSERKFRFLTENVSDNIWTADLGLHMTYTNPSIEKILGYTVEEALSLPLHRMLTRESFRVFMAAVNEELARLDDDGGSGKVKTVALEGLRKDGTSVWTETSLQVIRSDDASQAGILCVTRDVSDRMRAEEALRERDERLRIIAANSFDFLWMTDLELNFTYFSPSVERMGYAVDDLVSLNLRDIATARSIDTAFALLAKELAIAGRTAEEPATIFDLELIRKDGTTFRAEVSAGFLRDADGKPYGLLGTARDIQTRTLDLLE
ncbi:MAG: PAS domain-containing protein [Candidatus Geothermincolia bacterium]